MPQHTRFVVSVETELRLVSGVYVSTHSRVLTDTSLYRTVHVELFT